MNLSRRIAIGIGSLFLVLFLLIGSITLYVSYRVLKHENEKALVSITSVSADRLHKVIEGQLKILSMLANQPSVQGLNYRNQQFTLSKHITELGYLDMAVVSKDGQGRYILEDKTIDLSSREYIKTALNGHPTISDVIISKVTGEPVVMYAVPILNSKKEVIAALIARRNGDALTDLISDFEYGSSGYAYMINNHGDTIAHKNRDLIYEQFNPIEASKTDDSLTSLATSFKKMIAENNGLAECTYKGEVRYNAFESVPNTNWKYVIAVKQSEVYKEADALKNILLCMFGVALIIAIIAAFLIGRSIARPIQKLTTVVERQANYQFQAIDKQTFESELKRKDEVGTMAQALITMNSKLRKLISNVSENTEHVSVTSKNLMSTANNTAQSVDEVSHAIDYIAKDATIQATNTNSASEALNGLSKEIDLNKSQIDAMSSATETISTMVAEGINVLDTLSAQTVQTQRASHDLYQSINKTDQSSARIGEASQLISSISEQTNLLALNASIDIAVGM